MPIGVGLFNYFKYIYKMNVCSYKTVSFTDQKGINDRLSLLFKAVCQLQYKTGSKGVFADNAAALSGGLKVGETYNTSGGDLKIVV
jgi:hypothetical protein